MASPTTIAHPGRTESIGVSGSLGAIFSPLGVAMPGASPGVELVALEHEVGMGMKDGAA